MQASCQLLLETVSSLRDPLKKKAIQSPSLQCWNIYDILRVQFINRDTRVLSNYQIINLHLIKWHRDNSRILIYFCVCILTHAILSLHNIRSRPRDFGVSPPAWIDYPPTLIHMLLACEYTMVFANFTLLFHVAIPVIYLNSLESF